jgi:hypothetical protein
MLYAMLVALIMVLAAVSPAHAQAAPPVNPSQLQWNYPVTNADGTALVDLAKFFVRVQGPQPTAGFTACPAYTPNTYFTKLTVVATTATPTPSTPPAIIGTANNRDLAGLLGLSGDGMYCVSVTAVDLTSNEGNGAAPIPFERSISPGAPTGMILK